MKPSSIFGPSSVSAFGTALNRERQQAHYRALRTAALFMAVSLSALAFANWLLNNPRIALMNAAMAGMGLVLAGLLHFGQMRIAQVISLIGWFVLALVNVWVNGSVRDFNAHTFLALLLYAGAFFSPRVLMATTFAIALALSGLMWMELHGLMATYTADSVTARDWLGACVTFVIVALILYYHRGHAERAIAQQEVASQQAGETEQERDRSMRRFARLFAFNPAPSMAVSADTGLIVDVNPAFEHLYGYRREDLIAKPESVLWNEGLPPTAFADAVLPHKDIPWRTATLRCGDGQSRPVSMRRALLQEPEGKLIMMVCRTQF